MKGTAFLFVSLALVLAVFSAFGYGRDNAPLSGVMPVSDDDAPPAAVSSELKFTEVTIQRYIVTFPPFSKRLKEISALNDADPESEENRQKILALTRENEELILAKGWSGTEAFMDYNGRMIQFLTPVLLLKQFSAASSKYPQAKAQFQEQMQQLEKELGREELQVLQKNADRIKRMYISSGMKELEQIK